MKLLTAGLCVFFLAFATLRAVRVPLTYDEAASHQYVDTSTPSVFDTSALDLQFRGCDESLPEHAPHKAL
jgi:hypothetical protein